MALSLQRKRFFLTYPQCDLERDVVFQSLSSLAIARQALAQRLIQVEITQPFEIQFEPLTAPCSPMLPME